MSASLTDGQTETSDIKEGKKDGDKVTNQEPYTIKEIDDETRN